MLEVMALLCGHHSSFDLVCHIAVPQYFCRTLVILYLQHKLFSLLKLEI